MREYRVINGRDPIAFLTTHNSADHGAVDEVFIEHSGVDTRRGALRHQDGDKLLLRVDPEARTQSAGQPRRANQSIGCLGPVVI
jgi:hypothetical protein